MHDTCKLSCRGALGLTNTKFKVITRSIGIMFKARTRFWMYLVGVIFSGMGALLCGVVDSSAEGLASEEPLLDAGDPDIGSNPPQGACGWWYVERHSPREGGWRPYNPTDGTGVPGQITQGQLTLMQRRYAGIQCSGECVAGRCCLMTSKECSVTANGKVNKTTCYTCSCIVPPV